MPESAPTRIDPQAAEAMARLAALCDTPLHALAVAEARRLYREARLGAAAGSAANSPEVASIGNFWLDGPGGPVGVRAYRGLGTDPHTALPAVLYFHGGGWTCGDLDTHDGPCRQIANNAACAVFSVDYRLAPEHKFPAAFEDALAALDWVLEEAQTLQVDRRRIAVAGDSNGANLAAAVALALRDRGTALALQALVYPTIDLRAEAMQAFASRTEFASDCLHDRESIEWSIANYLRHESDAADWRASPMLAGSLRGAAPAYVLTAGFDPFRDEGRAYAARLLAEGVTATSECFEGQVHGFINLGGTMAAAPHAMYRVGQALRTAFRKIE